jgi:hypothetical protein
MFTSSFSLTASVCACIDTGMAKTTSRAALRRPTVELDRHMADAVEMYAATLVSGINIPRTAVVHMLLKETLEKKGIKFHPTGEPWMG